ncbi:hypothetical protein T484DRAFT_1610155, partial [Baffinella frigidus]
PQTPNPKPQTPNPKPQTLNPKPQTPNPTPQTPHPTPHTPHPRPQTRNPEPLHQAVLGAEQQDAALYLRAKKDVDRSFLALSHLDLGSPFPPPPSRNLTGEFHGGGGQNSPVKFRGGGVRNNGEPKFTEKDLVFPSGS